jgi:transcription-repair coupling factor (superfamily II helicase)
MPTGLRPDTQITFGSDDDNPEEDEDDYYDEEENQYIKKRDEVVQKALDEQDKEFREERRRKVWGDFADAKTAEDIEKVKQTLKEKIDKENKFKSQLAKQQGVDMEILEAPESDEGFSDNDSSDFQIRSGSGKSWYDNMDEDLKQEWAAMGEAGGDASDGEEESDEKEESSVTDDTVAIGGKIVSRDTLKGVRVGSAGGWTLEVFPGDFVVHRKYGIGRFEKTCTTPRLKLTREEVKARDARRKELITEKLREAKGGIPQDMIQKLQATFGTEDDTDPISNPQVTVLEITYADGIVHVPVDRAYRLSRYRAGNAAIKPRLSKVRGDQWRNARKKVEASTLELAQDVLALYATRETLQRQPFDPDNESQVHTFEKTFKFEPTKDQKKCFEDVENDMVWRSRPMDRLICGDVG